MNSNSNSAIDKSQGSTIIHEKTNEETINPNDSNKKDFLSATTITQNDHLSNTGDQSNDICSKSEVHTDKILVDSNKDDDHQKRSIQDDYLKHENVKDNHSTDTCPMDVDQTDQKNSSNDSTNVITLNNNQIELGKPTNISNDDDHMITDEITNHVNNNNNNNDQTNENTKKNLANEDIQKNVNQTNDKSTNDKHESELLTNLVRSTNDEINSQTNDQSENNDVPMEKDPSIQQNVQNSEQSNTDLPIEIKQENDYNNDLQDKPKLTDFPLKINEIQPEIGSEQPNIVQDICEPILHPCCQFQSDKSWLDLQFIDKEKKQIKKPDSIVNDMNEPTGELDENILNKIQGSIIGMAIGDALGASVEFRSHEYLIDNPVEDFQSGGTWGLEKGQFTDDTTMGLCLAASLIARQDFVLYDQLVRYKWWYQHGYMSSIGECFDIGATTRQSLDEFERRQRLFSQSLNISPKDFDYLSDLDVLQRFDPYCSEENAAGNGALMRLAPVPLFFYKYPLTAVQYSGLSGKITHGDERAYDACRYYGALIVATLHGETKENLLSNEFYSKHKNWFGDKQLHPDIKLISEGSFKKNGYDQGIRGKAFIVQALEAALWAFWSDEGSFEKGARAAVNLGDDTDTTAAIYGQLAGAFYGYNNLPEKWIEQIYAKRFMEILSKWIVYEGSIWNPKPQT